MTSVYRNALGRDTIRRWCAERLGTWDVPHATFTVPTRAGTVHIVESGEGLPTVVFVPGTTFNAAVCLPWLEALSTKRRVLTVDVPGQPGLSGENRKRFGRSAWYARMLSDVLDATSDQAIVVGNSLGAAIALACDSPRIAGRVLVSPGGMVWSGLSPVLVWRSTAWLARPGTRSAANLLRLFMAPGVEPPELDVEWMALVGRHCRPSLAPPPLPSRLLRARAAVPCLVSTGEHDLFFGPSRLGPAVAKRLGADLRVREGMGHLTPPDRVGEVAALVDELAHRLTG